MRDGTDVRAVCISTSLLWPFLQRATTIQLSCGLMFLSQDKSCTKTMSDLMSVPAAYTEPNICKVCKYITAHGGTQGGGAHLACCEPSFARE